MRTRLTAATFAISVGLLASACGSGESAIDAGNDPGPTTTATGVPESTAPPGDVTEGTDPADAGDGPDQPEPDATTPDVTTEPSEVTATTEAPVSALEGLPGCPVDALDAADQPVEITFWHGMTADNLDSIETLIETYNASQDRVVVRAEGQGGYIEVSDKFYQSSGSSRPDVVMFPEWGFQQAVDSQSFVPAGACIEAAGFDTSPVLGTTLDAYQQGGVQWGMPFNVSNVLLYYNKRVFEAAGLDPEVAPATFEELRSFSEQIIESGAASYGLAVDTNIDGGGGWYIEQWFATANELYANNGNGRELPATELLLDGEYGLELVTMLQEMEADGVIVNVGDNPNGTDTFLKMADEAAPAALTLGTSAGLGTVINVLGSGLVPDLGPDDVGVAPMPNSTGVPSSLVGGAANYIVDGHGDDRTAAAWDFMAWLLTPEAQSFWSEATGYIPIVEGAVDTEPLATTYAADPRYRVAYEQLANSPQDLPHAGAVLGPHRQIRNATAAAIAAVYNGADVATALADATTTADALLRQWADLNAAG